MEKSSGKMDAEVSRRKAGGWVYGAETAVGPLPVSGRDMPGTQPGGPAGCACDDDKPSAGY